MPNRSTPAQWLPIRHAPSQVRNWDAGINQCFQSWPTLFTMISSLTTHKFYIGTWYIYRTYSCNIFLWCKVLSLGRTLSYSKYYHSTFLFLYKTQHLKRKQINPSFYSIIHLINGDTCSKQRSKSKLYKKTHLTKLKSKEEVFHFASCIC